MNAPQHLYVMRSGTGLIKIGRSSSPLARLRTLQLVSGMQIELVAVLPDRGSEERAVHAALARYRLNGEWFSPRGNFRSDLAKIIGVELFQIRPIEDHRRLISERALKRSTHLTRILSDKRRRLTQQLVDDIMPSSRAQKLSDGGGLFLFVSPTGFKSWRFRYLDAHRREQCLTLGSSPEMPLAEARTECEGARMSARELIKGAL